MTERGTVAAFGAEIAFRLDGPPTAPALVLANSLGTTTGIWDDLVAPLSGHFRLVRYDLRGHGASGAPPGPYAISDLGADVLCLVDALGLDRFAFCGISIGGMAGMWLAAHAPERVVGLVLAATAPVLGPAEYWRRRAAAVRAEGTAPLVETAPGRWFTPAFAEASPTLVERATSMLAACDPEAYACCCEVVAAMDLRAELAAVVAPTLVVSGAEDPVVPPAKAAALVSSLAGASLLVLSPASHLVCVERPGAFADAVLRHLVGVPAERGLIVRRGVLGDDHVERAAAATTAFTAPFQDFITRYAWGDIWSRPGLDRRTRSAVTLSMLVALGRFEELSFHVPAAVRNGLSPDEIGEVLLHAAIYCGVPFANEAFRVASAALGEAGEVAGETGGER